ncbi:MAG: hypothetical protein NC483_03205 [Ruminococcus sp.]|nr:hypothetical protein [Ruminococcus sp.]
MEKNKKKVLIIVGFILIFIAGLAIFLSKNLKSPDKESNKPNINENPIKTDITRLDDVSKYFGLQKLINDYYLMLSNNETIKLLSVLDNEYINDKAITSNNIYSIIKSDYEMTTFTAKNIYYNPNSTTTYYFINGYLIDDEMMGENSNYYENINYLITVDETNRNYTIMPLENNINIEDYAKKYNITQKEISNSFNFSYINVSEETKLTSYLNEFLNLLIYDNNKAYNLLQDATKKEYQNANDFKNKMLDIYSRFSSKIFSYSKKENGNTIIYNIKDDNQNSITIIESGIMDYKIAY